MGNKGYFNRPNGIFLVGPMTLKKKIFLTLLGTFSKGENNPNNLMVQIMAEGCLKCVSPRYPLHVTLLNNQTLANSYPHVLLIF